MKIQMVFEHSTKNIGLRRSKEGKYVGDGLSNIFKEVIVEPLWSV